MRIRTTECIIEKNCRERPPCNNLPLTSHASLEALGRVNETVVKTVCAAKGDPGKYEKGSEIKRIVKANAMDGVQYFHAKIKSADGKILANRGWFLNIKTAGETLKEAVDWIYSAINNAIDWPEGFCRCYIANHVFKA